MHGDWVVTWSAGGPAQRIVGQDLGGVSERTCSPRLRIFYLLAVAALAGWAWLALSLHLSGLFLGAGVLAIMVTMATLSHRRGE